MFLNRDSFKFLLLDESGKSLRSAGVSTVFGTGSVWRGKLDADDDVVVAIRSVCRNESPDQQRQLLLRSFSVGWLTGKSRNLGRVVAYAIALPDSVSYISRIGLLGRTAQSLAQGTIAIAETVLLLDTAWDIASGSFDAPTPGECAGSLASDLIFDWLLPDEIFKSIDASYGEPGNPCPTVAFQPEATISFLQICQMRVVVDELKTAESLKEQLQKLIDQRILALFLTNSRQIEGLIISGASQASAAVVAHAAMAMGLSENIQAQEILNKIEQAIEHLPNPVRANEARNTLAGIRKNLTGEVHAIERRLQRHLASSITTDAIDLATTPVTMTMDLLATVARGLGKVSGNGKASMMFAASEQGFKTASSVVDKVPDAIGYIIKGGLTSEEWARGFAQKVWPFGKSRQGKETDIQSDPTPVEPDSPEPE